MKYAVIVHPAGTSSWNAYVPDLDGVVAAAETRERVIELIREAIPFHLRGLREAGEPVPQPSSEALTVSA
jgi:predicted RNase H-like HicB family nuclease